MKLPDENCATALGSSNRGPVGIDEIDRQRAEHVGKEVARLKRKVFPFEDRDRIEAIKRGEPQPPEAA